ncbi:MAG: hypothetical protein HYV07_19265 [Deltaproteobacteria bacterium]|nr:hypothetical protein [Deltaproteobacteria bacterium]
MLPLFVLTAGAVAVQVIDAGDLAASEASAFGRELAASVEARVGQPIILMDSKFKGCARPRCDGASDPAELVTLKLDPGATRVAVSIERLRDGERVAAAEELGPFEAYAWRGRFDALVAELFREPLSIRAAPPKPDLVAMLEPPQSSVPWLAPTFIGAGVLAAAGGIAFGIAAANAQAELETRLLVDDELAAAEHRAATLRGVAAGLLGVALVSAVGAAIVILAQ